MLFSTLSFSQLFCELGPRDNFLKNVGDLEYSGLAYHIEREIFFMPLDDPKNGIHFIGYNIQENNQFNIEFSDPESLITKKDFEGLTYLEKDYFVLLEEKENKVYFLEYIVRNSGNPFFEVLSGHETGIEQASRDAKDGLEGISYDPHTKRLYVVREKEDVRLFSIPITLPNAGFSGSINEQQKCSVALPLNIEPSGLFHLGKVFPVSNHLSNNLLVIDDKLLKIREYKLVLDTINNLLSIEPKAQIDILTDPKPEGIAVYNNNIYIASEKTTGGLSSYAINPSAAFCNTDSTQGQIEVWDMTNCMCEPAPNAGCTDSKACNYDASATMDDCSCLYQNAVCDDGNDKTINDRIDENCNCKGIPSCQCQHVD